MSNADDRVVKPSILRGRIAEKSLKDAQLPVSGIFRLGTKVLTKMGRENQEVVRLHDAYKRGEMTSKDAEKQAEKHGVKYPFSPVNTQHFNIHPLEIEGGQAALDNLLQLYGENRGDSGMKIYRFPVLFPDVPNGIDGVFKSKFAVPVGQVKYWSEYGDDGARYCKYRQPVDPAKQAARKKFLPRESVIRGKCDPGTCAEFGAGVCRFEGTLHFYVPGVTGSGTFIIKTGSASAAEDVFLRLDDLYTRCRGKLPNFTPDGRPVFFLTKIKKVKPYFDEQGKEKMSEQWVLSLETVIDMSKVILLEEKTKAAALAAPKSPAMPDIVPAAWAVGVVPKKETEPEPVQISNALAVSSPQPAAAQGAASQVATATGNVDEITTYIQANELDEEVVNNWAIAKFGDDWFDDPIKIASVMSDVRSIVDARGAEAALLLFDLQAKLYEHSLSPRELGMPYFLAKFGKLKSIDLINSALAHCDELIRAGNTVAKTTMVSFLSK